MPAELDNVPDIATSTPTAGTVKIVQSVRQNCYTVTDGELKSLALANGLVVIFFSLASATATFGIDLVKDIAMATELTAQGIVLDRVVKPISFVLTVIFVGAGAWALWWRHGMLALIRRESRGA